MAGDLVKGEMFGLPDLHLTVLSVDGRRIGTVKVERIALNDDRVGEKEHVSDESSSQILGNPKSSVSNST